MVKKHPIKVVLAKPGLDGHDRGINVVSLALRDAGMEVVYLGRQATPEQIVETAIQEGANLIGMSILSDTHMDYCPQVIDLLREKNAGNTKVILGGFIPNQKDVRWLKKYGVAEVFGTGSSLDAIVKWINENV